MQESLLKQSSVAEPISILPGNAIQVEWICKAKQFSVWTWCLSTFQAVLLWPTFLLDWTPIEWSALGPPLKCISHISSTGRKSAGAYWVLSMMSTKALKVGNNWETFFKTEQKSQTKMILWMLLKCYYIDVAHATWPEKPFAIQLTWVTGHRWTWSTNCICSVDDFSFF